MRREDVMGPQDRCHHNASSRDSALSGCFFSRPTPHGSLGRLSSHDNVIQKRTEMDRYIIH